MGRNVLLGTPGDATNAVMAAVGYNFPRLVAWLKAILRVLWLLQAVLTLGAQYRTCGLRTA